MKNKALPLLILAGFVFSLFGIFGCSGGGDSSPAVQSMTPEQGKANAAKGIKTSNSQAAPQTQ